MSHHPTRRAALAATAGAGAALATPGLVRAQAPAAGAYPSRPITLLVPFPPGGQTDFAGRIVQTGMQQSLGQPVVIDNRPGASGFIGTEAVMRGRPDGYTLLVGNSATMTISPHTLQNVTLNPLETAPIGVMLQSALVLVVHPSLPVRNVQDLAAWIKQQPRGADYGVSSAGALTHCAMELFRQKIGNPAMEMIPYRGSGPAMSDLITNRFGLMFDASSVLAAFIRSGQVRPLMVTSPQRVPAFPDVPTAAEAGIPDFVVQAWIGLYAHKDTPADILTRANTALKAALTDPTVRERITSLGDEPGGADAAELGERTRREHALWSRVVRDANIKAE
ncbi:Bug family tripartite tricarboxylate transporter substrate binding protein [Roseomonas sp. CCTCC AB2023176]|uniref:Bug family tripartite tricarboxylate transporter substrate binding protein n=1 Tax=Roseomonas sp. CCTCC AB2023176 TaxID=3342640 RepID=UPI0035E23103